MTTIRTAAAHAEVDVIPHAEGVGLGEAVQHFAFFNAVSGADGPGCYVRLYHSRAVPSNSRLRSWSLSPVVIASAESVTPW